jgi:hypothetical protein
LTEEDINESYEKYNVFHILETKTREALESVHWFIDCGADDFLYEGNNLVHIALQKKGVKHQFRNRDGGHTGRMTLKIKRNKLQQAMDKNNSHESCKFKGL